MDRHNNVVGRRIGRDTAIFASGRTERVRVAKIMCLDALNEGVLWRQ